MNPDNKWVSAVIRKNDQYKTELITDTHTVLADEPLDNGGQDTAPSPGDFMRMSLASCTAITLRMYANRKGYDIDRIEVKVHTENVGEKTVFHREVIIDGVNDEAIRKRLLQIANMCPVHKMLTSPIEIATTGVWPNTEAQVGLGH
jgi:putative redox protein